MLREQLGFLFVFSYSLPSFFFHLKCKNYLAFLFSFLFPPAARVCGPAKFPQNEDAQKKYISKNRKCLSFLLCPELMVPPIICYSDFFSPSSRKHYATECEQRRRGEGGTIMDAIWQFFCGKDGGGNKAKKFLYFKDLFRFFNVTVLKRNVFFVKPYIHVKCMNVKIIALSLISPSQKQPFPILLSRHFRDLSETDLTEMPNSNFGACRLEFPFRVLPGVEQYRREIVMSVGKQNRIVDSGSGSQVVKKGTHFAFKKSG